MNWDELYSDGELTEKGQEWADTRESNFDDTASIDDKLKGLTAPKGFIDAYREYLLDWQDVYASAI